MRNTDTDFYLKWPTSAWTTVRFACRRCGQFVEEFVEVEPDLITPVAGTEYCTACSVERGGREAAKFVSWRASDA